MQKDAAPATETDVLSAELSDADASVSVDDVDGLTEVTEDWINDIHDWLAERFFAGELGDGEAMLIIIGGTLILAGLLHVIARLVIGVVVKYVVRRTTTTWDDILVDQKLFSRSAHLVPAVVVYLLAPLFISPSLEMDWEVGVRRCAAAYMTIVGMLLFTSLLNAAVDIYGTFERVRQNPIKGFAQGAKILVYLVGTVFLIAALTGRDPWRVVAGIGAITAIVMLVFKDSILGLVASIQIFVNDMVNVGDWIEMPKFGADGAVLDVTLTTVKVQNWDNTITTIPTYAITSDSFKNWRGMEKSGGRRIKRAIMLDMNTIKFCTPSMLERFQRIDILREYLSERTQQIEQEHQHQRTDAGHAINSRRLTNIGTFRIYLVEYVRRLPELNSDMTLLVRQLAPTREGLPIELYFFSSNTAWVEFESIQADLFDHILSVASEFDLALFQSPTGADFRGIGAEPAGSQTVSE
ncbi:MAG: mechanosensitive ion channel domain-containing protein [Planctomycetaceae bacterium]